MYLDVIYKEKVVLLRYSNEMARKIFKLMNVKKLQGPENVSAIWVIRKSL